MMNSFRFYLFHTWCFRKPILIALSYKKVKNNNIYLSLIGSGGPSVTEQSERPMDTVAYNSDGLISTYFVRTGHVTGN